MLSPCQRYIDIVLYNFYNICEVIIVVMKPGTKTVTLRISKELYEDILNEANIEERSVNNFISYAVKTYIENKKECIKK